MSFFLGTRFDEGILFASDSFIFDNDGDVPSKAMNFEKMHVHHKLGMAMAFVGSSWVFHSFVHWLNTHSLFYYIIKDIPDKWKELNVQWKTNREIEMADADQKSLRPVSDSLLFIARQKNLKTIYVIDYSGNSHLTETFVISGSGSDIAGAFLKSEGKIFSLANSLKDCMELMQPYITRQAMTCM